MTADVAIYSTHDEIRLLLRGLLRLHHYRVVAEGSAPKGLSQIPPKILPIVVLDADLDEMGWSEAVSELRHERPELRIVLLSATRSPRVESQAAALGIAAVVRRPFAVHQLVEAIDGSGILVAPPSISETPYGR